MAEFNIPKAGEICWRELRTKDLGAAIEFYAKLFGWTLQQTKVTPMDYKEIIIDDTAHGGMMSMEGDDWGGAPSHWATYVAVDNADETKRALDAGADILIAQGWEAGGHVRGTLTTFALVPTVVDLAGSVPVLAAGGVVDGRGLASMLALGASGVMMGTRFVASEESRAHPDYKKAITTARQTDAVYLKNLFEVGWPDAPHRVLRNSTVRAWEAAGSPPSGSRPNEKEVVATRPDGSPVQRYSAPHPMAGMTGNIEALAHYAGQGVERVIDILPAAKIIEATMHQAREQLSQFKA